MKPYINVNERVFLIRYNFQMGKQVICAQKDIADTLRENNNLGGIDYIKEFIPSKAAFKAVSKKQLLLYFDWDIEAMDELKKNHLI
jgi:hypothetical protein